ncbi:MAG: 4--2-furancarboxaldehyde phosphate synthase MfnB [Candidatus Alkanophagales archaeon MCA70_species_1]|nr:4--2-furancarboxaldehyde phosphate synthase MfnB [Candidatus Alkanophaga volatiphilum]
MSPKDLDEARAAVRGHADIIDVKNPREGSLGANFPWVIRRIKEEVSVPVSATIGDFDFKPGTAALAALGAAVSGAEYIKVGLFGIKTAEQAIELLKAVVKAVKEFDGGKKVVSAFYSDYSRIGSVSPFELPRIASEVDIDVAMVDTAIKDGKSTFEFLSENELKKFVADAHEFGLETAIAGSLKFEDIPAVKRINPDIIGVRGMLCGGDRNGRIKEELVRRLKSML